jgi:hypothetical protein
VVTAGGRIDVGPAFLMAEAIDGRSSGEILKRYQSAYASLGLLVADKWQPVLTVADDFKVESSLFPSLSTTYSMTLAYFLDQSNVLKVMASHVDFQKRTTDLGAGQTSSTMVSSSGNPEDDFQVFGLEWSFFF